MTQAELELLYELFLQEGYEEETYWEVDEYEDKDLEESLARIRLKETLFDSLRKGICTIEN
jgi:hypothetical protein